MKLHLYKERQIILARKDFVRIQNTINRITLSNAYVSLPAKHVDYHIGSLTCLNNQIFIDIIDESDIDHGIWIQIRTHQKVLYRISASISRITSPVYINTLIDLLDEYAHAEPLKIQLQLRPFGTDYEYHPI